MILADPIQHIVGVVHYDCPECGRGARGQDTRLRIKYIMDCVFFCPNCHQVWLLKWHKSTKITEDTLREDGWLQEKQKQYKEGSR